jgi:hypothetical protein
MVRPNAILSNRLSDRNRSLGPVTLSNLGGDATLSTVVSGNLLNAQAGCFRQTAGLGFNPAGQWSRLADQRPDARTLD